MTPQQLVKPRCRCEMRSAELVCNKIFSWSSRPPNWVVFAGQPLEPQQIGEARCWILRHILLSRHWIGGQHAERSAPTRIAASHSPVNPGF